MFGSGFIVAVMAMYASLNHPHVVHRIVPPPPTPIAVVIERAFGERAEEAKKVAWCESRDHPDSRNGQFWGLFQIGVKVHAPLIASMGYTADDMLRAEPNARVAAALQAQQGWRPWSCRPE